MRHLFFVVAALATVSACANSGLGISPPAESASAVGSGLEVYATSPLAEPAPEARLAHPVYPFHEGDWPEQPVAPALGIEGGGTIVADLNGDELLDIVLVGADHADTRLFLQTPGGWTNATSRLPLGSLDGGGSFEGGVGGSAADYDGDGDLDLLLTSWVQNRLLVNDGSGTFTDHTERAGLISDPRHTVSASWGDVEGDGDLDLLMGTFGPEPVAGAAPTADASWLYRNLGDGTFVDVSGLLPAKVHEARLFSTALVDIDHDGLPEIVSVADSGGAPTGLFWNIGGVWVSDRQFSSPRAGMGLALGDTNTDGVLDLAQSSYQALSLLESLGSTWFDSATASGLTPDTTSAGQDLGWGTEFGDLDNDGDLDLFVTFGAWDAMPGAAAQRDALYLREGERYTDAAAAWEVDAPAAGRGLVLADLDRDGWLDLVRRNVGEAATVHLQNGGTESWSVLSLTQPGANPDAIGATIVVESGGVRQTRSVLAGSTGMFSGGPPEVHFGLGSAERLDRVEITWPDGTLDVLEDLEGRRFIEIRRL